METKKRGIKYETEKAKINMEGSEGGGGHLWREGRKEMTLQWLLAVRAL